MDNLTKKRTGIGTLNERSLHQSLKEWYVKPEDRLEVSIDGYIIDIVRADLLIEIQTRNFAALKNKLENLLNKHQIRLVYPITKEKWITLYDERKTEILHRRKSPKKGQLFCVFDELIRMPALIKHPNLSLEVLLIQEDEIRCADGNGSWRRKGVSIIDRRLIQVLEKKEFVQREDFLNLLPVDLRQPFSTKDLAQALQIKVNSARKMAYCLKKMELVQEVGKRGNALLYAY